jgi:hypothetical protein
VTTAGPATLYGSGQRAFSEAARSAARVGAVRTEREGRRAELARGGGPGGQRRARGPAGEVPGLFRRPWSGSVAGFFSLSVCFGVEVDDACFRSFWVA